MKHTLKNKNKLKLSNANDFLLAVSLFQKYHPYTEILSIGRESWYDPVLDKDCWAYAFKTNKNTIFIRVDNINLG